MEHFAVTGATIAVSVACLSWALMSTLRWPRLGCWLLYLTTLLGTICVLALGVFAVIASYLIKQLVVDRYSPGLVAVSAVIGAILMYVGKRLLAVRGKQAFGMVMKLLLRWSFQRRVGNELPLNVPTDDPRRLAFRAVFDASYPDPRYGKVVGWGVRASCKRLLAIRSNKRIVGGRHKVRT